MRSDHDEALERGGGPRRLLRAGAAGLGSLLAAAALLSGVFDNGLPALARAEAAPVVAAESGPAPSAPGLCFHGPGGELLDFASAGRRCP